MNKQFKKELDELLSWAYDKGQAYYTHDYYDKRDESEEEWEIEYEWEYQTKTLLFLLKYGMSLNESV